MLKDLVTKSDPDCRATKTAGGDPRKDGTPTPTPADDPTRPAPGLHLVGDTRRYPIAGRERPATESLHLSRSGPPVPERHEDDVE